MRTHLNQRAQRAHISMGNCASVLSVSSVVKFITRMGVYRKIFQIPYLISSLMFSACLAIYAILDCCSVSAQNNTSIVVDPVSDARNEGRIQAVLDFNNYLETADIKVRVSGGVTYLRGEVQSNSEKDFAEKIASKLGGSQNIVNNITVNQAMVRRSPSDLEMFVSDEAITCKIVTKFASSKLLYGSDVKVETKNGSVSLTGFANNQPAIEQANKLAKNTLGVKLVKNSLQIGHAEINDKEVKEPLPTLEEFTAKISDAWISSNIRSHVNFDPKYSGSDIYVVTNQGKVILRGKALSFYQKESISQEVPDIIGVHEVENNLVVE